MNEDIVQLLYGIKVNIAAIEGGDKSPLRLEEVKRDCIRLLELLKLFLIDQRDSYYGYFLMNLRYEVDFTSKSIAGILLGRFPPVFHTNPLLLCKFSLKEILFILCHEIDHIVLNHPAEMLKANPDGDKETFERFNLAADASVNDRILKEMQNEKLFFLSEPQGIVSSGVFKNFFHLSHVRPLESYLYYFQLIQQKHVPGGIQEPDRMLKAAGTRGDEDGDSDEDASNAGKKEPQSQKTGESENGKDAGEGEGDSIVTAQSCDTPTDHNWDAGEDAEGAKAAVRELVNSAVALMNEEQRGLMPGSFWQQVKNLNAPPALCWQSILKKYVGAVPDGKRKTRMRLNRRQPERFDLSGQQDDKVLNIVVAIDTSGSVSDRDVSDILNEVTAIIARRKHVLTVIECDSQVQRVYQVKTKADIKPNVAGRGGTAFTPAIEYINGHREFRGSLLIYFTDGFGESIIPRPRTYRNLWVVLEDVHNLSVQEPYGQVIALKKR